MRILAVCQYYYPEEFRINETCEALAAEGHTVTVLTGLPNYPSGHVPSEFRWGRGRSETRNGVNIIRSFEIGRHAGVARLAMNYASFMISGSITALRLRDEYDVIFVYQLSPVLMALPGIIAKKRLGTPLFLYCLDLWPESLRNLIAGDQNPLFRLVGRASRYIYSQCDAIAVTSRPFADYFNQVHGVPLDVITYLPQYADQTPVAPVRTGNVTNFVFTGNIGIAQDIDCILTAAEQLARTHHEFRVHFVGDGSYLSTAKSLVSDKCLEGIVVFHGRRPVAEMQSYYAMADACLLTLKGGSWVSLTMPSKLQGYMAAGKPVIGAINGAAQEVIREARCGICVDAGDATALASAMSEFMSNPQRHHEWGANGRAYYQTHFTREIFLRRLVQELESCADGAMKGEADAVRA